MNDLLDNLKKLLNDILAYFKDVKPDVKPMETPTLPTPVTPVEPKYKWDSPQNCRHSIRVLCDELNVSVSDKNIITACIKVESNFNPKAVGINKNGSKDYGIVQINDHFWIGKGKEFPSSDYVLNNPENCVRWMIKQWKAGHQNWWVSYTSGAYKKYL